MKLTTLLLTILSLNSLSANLLDRFQIINKNNSADVVASKELGVNFIGGSGRVRADVIDLNPVHVSLPKFKAGCGGIDYNMGAFHIASGEEMVNTLKAIIKNGAGYSFQLALETVSPSVAEKVAKVQEFANVLNTANINSCEMAQNLVNAAWPSSEAADQFICQQSNSAFGKHGQNFIEGRHKCHANIGDAKDKALKEQSKNTDLLAGDYNLAKRIFAKMSLSQEEQNFFLNITGTVVSINGQVTTYPPKAIKTCDILLNGGNLTDSYKFDGDFEIKQEPLIISTENSWSQKRLKAIQSLYEKIKMGKEGDGTLTQVETELLNSSKLPLGTLLTLKTRSENYGAILDLLSYAEIEAYESIREAVFSVLLEMRGLAITLLGAQVAPEDLKSFIAAIDETKANITFESSKLIGKITEIQQLEKWLRDVEMNQRMKQQ